MRKNKFTNPKEEFSIELSPSVNNMEQNFHLSNTIVFIGFIGILFALLSFVFYPILFSALSIVCGIFTFIFNEKIFATFVILLGILSMIIIFFTHY